MIRNTSDVGPDSGCEPPVVVVGAGPVGLRFVEELARLNPHRHIVLFSGEPFKPYDRVKLSQVLARDLPAPSVYSRRLESPQVSVVDNCPIVAIDRAGKRVRDSLGNWQPYSRLVLALGSEPFVPGIPNVAIGNVFTFRDLRDTEALMARNLRSRHTVVLGGGLLGLETARAMLRNNTRVTVLQLGGHLMNRQLDDGAAALLEARVRELGMEVICGARVKAIVPREGAYAADRKLAGGVLLDGGTVIACDTVIIATGIRPRIELARNHGLSVATGIRVDEHLRTSDPSIYAIGECSQYREQIIGLVAPGLEQAAVAARHVSDGTATYKGAITSTSLKVVGLPVFSVGEVNMEISGSIRRHVYQDRAAGTYRACFTVNERLVGALAIGDWPEQQRVRASIGEGRKLYFWHRLRFRMGGCLWGTQGVEDIGNWPASMVVCNCTGATRGRLGAAKLAGALSCAALGAATGAGTVCGSCVPLLARFTGDSATAAGGKGLRWLAWLSAGAMAGVLLYWLFGPVPFTHSVRGFRPDLLWLDGDLKQLSGFTLLGLAAVSLLMSLNKRKRWLGFMSFINWRLFHTVLGVLALVVLLAHTGSNLGANLNRWLMLDFMVLLLLGGAAGLIISQEGRLPARAAKRVRGAFTWAHTLLSWPLPALLAFHIVSVYYF